MGALTGTAQAGPRGARGYRWPRPVRRADRFGRRDCGTGTAARSAGLCPRLAGCRQRRCAMSDELPEALEANTPSSLHRVVGEEGKRWMQFSDAELVGLVGWHEGNRVRDGASAEVQRRGMMAARELTETLRESIEVQERLVTAIDA